MDSTIKKSVKFDTKDIKNDVEIAYSSFMGIIENALYYEATHRKRKISRNPE